MSTTLTPDDTRTTAPHGDPVVRKSAVISAADLEKIPVADVELSKEIAYETCGGTVFTDGSALASDDGRLLTPAEARVGGYWNPGFEPTSS